MPDPEGNVLEGLPADVREALEPKTEEGTPSPTEQPVSVSAKELKELIESVRLSQGQTRKLEKMVETLQAQLMQVATARQPAAPSTNIYEKYGLDEDDPIHKAVARAFEVQERELHNLRIQTEQVVYSQRERAVRENTAGLLIRIAKAAGVDGQALLPAIHQLPTETMYEDGMDLIEQTRARGTGNDKTSEAAIAEAKREARKDTMKELGVWKEEPKPSSASSSRRFTKADIENPQEYAKNREGILAQFKNET